MSCSICYSYIKKWRGLLHETIKKHVDEAIVLDVLQWSNYGTRPSNLNLSPDSPFYKGKRLFVSRIANAT